MAEQKEKRDTAHSSRLTEAAGGAGNPQELPAARQDSGASAAGQTHAAQETHEPGADDAASAAGPEHASEHWRQFYEAVRQATEGLRE